MNASPKPTPAGSRPSPPSANPLSSLLSSLSAPSTNPKTTSRRPSPFPNPKPPTPLSQSLQTHRRTHPSPTAQCRTHCPVGSPIAKPRSPTLRPPPRPASTGRLPEDGAVWHRRSGALPTTHSSPSHSHLRAMSRRHLPVGAASRRRRPLPSRFTLSFFCRCWG